MVNLTLNCSSLDVQSWNGNTIRIDICGVDVVDVENELNLVSEDELVEAQNQVESLEDKVSDLEAEIKDLNDQLFAAEYELGEALE